MVLFLNPAALLISFEEQFFFLFLFLFPSLYFFSSLPALLNSILTKVQEFNSAEGKLIVWKVVENVVFNSIAPALLHLFEIQVKKKKKKLF
jgi:hypothetical protein